MTNGESACISGIGTGKLTFLNEKDAFVKQKQPRFCMHQIGWECTYSVRRLTKNGLKVEYDDQNNISIFKFSCLQNPLPINKNIIHINGITKNAISSLETVIIIDLSFETPLSHKFHLVSDDFYINTDGILGKDFLTRHNCNIDCGNMTFTVNSPTSSNILKISSGPDKSTLPYNAFIRVINTTNQTQIISNIIHQFKPLTNLNVYTFNSVTKDTNRSEKLTEILLRNTPSQFHDSISELIQVFSDVFASLLTK